MLVKLSDIVAGHRFRWAGVIFEATHEETEFEGRPSRRVICRQAKCAQFMNMTLD